MRVEKIAVLGGGNGGHAIAADLTLAGFDVALYELPKFKDHFQATLRRGEIEITGVSRQGIARLSKATTNIEEALGDAEVIIVSVPAFGHKTFAEVCADHLTERQIVVLMPGTAGSLEFAKVFRERGVERDIALAETATLPYGCRLTGPAKVDIRVVARILPTAAFPSKRTREVVDVLRELYPMVVPAKNVIETALNNPNPITHPPGTLLNVSRIEYSKGEFYLYKEGMTPASLRLLNKMDEERQALLKALGLRLHRCKEPLNERDRVLGTTMAALFGPGTMEVGSTLKGPTHLQDRYITEDVPYGLVFMSSLGDMLNVPTPTIKVVIQLFSIINQTDYFKEGRTVEKLGISGLTADELNKFLEEGRI